MTAGLRGGELAALTAGAAVEEENGRWLADLRSSGPAHDEAVVRLHALLLRAARHEASRRRAALPHLPARELDEIAHEAAGDAVVAVLARLDRFRGESRFATWATKFALLEAAVKLRLRAWQGRELPLADEAWSRFATTDLSVSERSEQHDLLAAVRAGIATELTPHQRHVLVALAVDGVPIDVLADRLGSTRNALYKALHDARRKLRAHLLANGFDLDAGEGSL